MTIEHLTSADDPRCAIYARLTDTQLRSRVDPTSARIICESQFVIEKALSLGFIPESILVAQEHLTRLLACLNAYTDKSIIIYTLPMKTMSELVGFRVHRGYFAAFARPCERELLSLAFSSAHTICVLQGISDVSNMGALFRSAAALGVDAIILDEACADPYNRRAIRTSMGAVLQLPWARIPKTMSLGDLARQLHAQNYTNCACALDDEAYRLGDSALYTFDKLALWFGSEGWGLSDEALCACDIKVMIEMHQNIDSLNVAASSAVIFWELAHKRCAL